MQQFQDDIMKIKLMIIETEEKLSEKIKILEERIKSLEQEIKTKSGNKK